MVNVEIVKEWRLPKSGEKFRRTTKENPQFYVVLLQKGRTRYLKIGTAENGVVTRFNGADYKKYSFIKILYVAELQATEKDKKNVCYHVEDLTRSALREMKGFTFVKNDRFKYFRLPDEIPVFTSMNNYTNIPLRVIGAENFLAGRCPTPATGVWYFVHYCYFSPQNFVYFAILHFPANLL